MDKAHFDEMVNCIERLAADGAFDGSAVYIFAHCEASLTLADELMTRGITPDMILDNSKEKWGIEYKGVMVGKPDHVLERDSDKAIVLIATRFYEAMRTQLLDLGFKGRIVKVVDYNTYSEYSLTDETIARKMERVRAGKEAIDAMRNGKQDEFLVFCPFAALGDIYFCMSYLPRFMEAREVGRAVVCVVGNACRKVAELFDIANCRVQVFSQNVLDSMVQAALYYRDENAFIAHQDRPYVVNLHNALKVKCIPLEQIYRCGIFGLSDDAVPVEPTRWCEYGECADIPEGKAVVLSPYAKSVTAMPDELWEKIADKYLGKGYLVYTNVVGDEKPVAGTMAISPDIAQMKSVVERAGIFIGIRSGMCDVLRTAKCRKIALFPNYNYGDTKWKAIDMYRLDEFENNVFDGDYAEVMEAL